MIVEESQSLTIFQSALYKTLSAVIRTDDMMLVVDPCWLPHEVEQIRRYVEERLDDRPLFLLFTHSDYDHIIGYGAFPQAKVIASRALAEKNVRDQETILEQIRSFDDDYYLDRDYEIVYPKVDYQINRDGQIFDIGDTRLVFYLSPGHNVDGIFTVVEPLGLWIAGDYLSDLEFPFIDYNSRCYEDSLNKLDFILSRHPVKALIPGHGAVARDIAEMKRRKEKDLAYISSMRRFVSTNNKQELDKLSEGCPYPRNMIKFHRSNQKQFEREQG